MINTAFPLKPFGAQLGGIVVVDTGGPPIKKSN
jgi:hypothetical protein